jgi:hypothetical protein
MAKSITDHLREHALTMAGCIDRKPMPDLETLRRTEWFPEFEQLMRNRIIMGAFRYCRMQDKGKTKYRMFDYLLEKAEVYSRTGNKEALVDIANMAALEFTFPSRENAHWSAGDDDSEHCKC